MARPARYLIREVTSDDVDALYHLSQFLNSLNFPHDLGVLSRMVAASQRSFAGDFDLLADGHYMFVLVPDDGGPAVGTATISGQHGTPLAPHVYFDVLPDERYSSTLDRYYCHTALRLGFSYNGPSEIGALVLDPQIRALGLGKPLSFARFTFLAMYRDRFRDEVIAELMPPLEPDGRSRLWEHIGRRFTGLDYQEADKLSQTNKEFIISLFPTEMNATLLPDDVQGLIGEVGEQTKGVRRMLENIGFEYANRIDPFDGGPHFHAKTDEITLVRDTREIEVSAETLPEDQEEAVLNQRHLIQGVHRALVARGADTGATRFRAVPAAVFDDESQVVLSAPARALVGVEPGQRVFITPLS